MISLPRLQLLTLRVAIATTTGSSVAAPLGSRGGWQRTPLFEDLPHMPVSAAKHRLRQRYERRREQQSRYWRVFLQTLPRCKTQPFPLAVKWSTTRRHCNVQPIPSHVPLAYPYRRSPLGNAYSTQPTYLNCFSGNATTCLLYTSPSPRDS